jgi:hypothetical protein
MEPGMEMELKMEFSNKTQMILDEDEFVNDLGTVEDAIYLGLGYGVAEGVGGNYESDGSGYGGGYGDGSYSIDGMGSCSPLEPRSPARIGIGWRCY